MSGVESVCPLRHSTLFVAGVPCISLPVGQDTIVRINGWGGVASAILESLRYPLVN